MPDVRTVFTAAEVAKMLDVTSSYVVRLAKTMKFTEAEVRKAGKGNYLFSKEAVEKMKRRNQ